MLSWEGRRPWDASDSRNRGVLEDMWVKIRDGHRPRLIGHVDPVTGKAYEFLTNEPDLRRACSPNFIAAAGTWRRSSTN